jgi:glycine cleavage system transcriptional repressor
MRYVSLTAIGKDSPGIVNAITGVLSEFGCNIEDSTMTILHGQFAMILIIKLGSEVNLKTLSSKLRTPAKRFSMSLSYAQIAGFSARKKKNSNACVVSVYGKDKTGIVHGISGFLASKKINITDVQTAVSKKTYIMIIEVELPLKLSIEKFSADLSVYAKTLNVAASVNRAESSEI